MSHFAGGPLLFEAQLNPDGTLGITLARMIGTVTIPCVLSRPAAIADTYSRERLASFSEHFGKVSVPAAA
jgi:hypothetical protein